MGENRMVVGERDRTEVGWMNENLGLPAAQLAVPPITVPVQCWYCLTCKAIVDGRQVHHVFEDNVWASGREVCST